MQTKKFGMKHVALASVVAACAVTPSALASLSSTYQFNGKGNWSIDAVGSNNTPVGIIEASVPVGSTVQKAFLYSSLFTTSSPDVSFDGTLYPAASWTPLGVNSGFLQAHRVDVTAQVAAKVGGGSASRFQFQVDSESPNNAVDGEVLVIVYSNPAETERTIAVLDGFSASTGDTTTINFSSPLSQVGQPGFEALLSLGIGFSHQPAGQFSIIDGNGRRLTSSAGGEDDGILANGGLITAGGLDDSPANPDPAANDSGGPRTDDELYDLGQGNVADPTPFLSNGLLSYKFDTVNPSQDDNIFFLGVNITARAGINEPPPPAVVPETSTVVSGLAVAGLAGLALRRRMRK
ncbi:MAG: hypothetical protein JNK85_22760 [Verrucomicrobiales bacterium]|nr:hypothetical protein [Verrucomicrobiales bacterium]